ncbi:hypothetical protein ARD30_20680 [Bosea thiooxidans]|uniref:AAA domain-containing protein n=1 Tax=Bosea thiooxidans TaxID=53254 RepID=A0A0Q3I1C0_9HYPH|nr:hypothetical protein ARD30_20680 [Bosea thiooxidans]
MVDFCFGGSLELTTAVQRELLSVQLTLTIGERQVLIERAKGEGVAKVSWIEDDGEPITLLIRTKGDGPVVYGDDVVNLSDLLLRLLGYPIIRVRKRTGDDDSPMVRLSFRDLLKFCYLEQEQLDSSFFRLGQPILAEKSKDALNFFAGYYSERLSTLQAEFDQARTDQRSKTEAAERIRGFLAQFGFASASQIDAEIAKDHFRLVDVQADLTASADDFFRQTHFVDEQRVRLRQMSNQLNAEQETLEDLDRRIEEQRELRAELMSMKFKVARADRARSVLSGSAFENCPQCGQPLAAHRAPEGSCYLCLQVVLPSSEEINPASISSDLEARLTDIEQALRRHAIARKRQTERIVKLVADKDRLDREVSELLSGYETDRAARSRQAEREVAEIEERIRFLNRVKAMPGAVTEMLAEADKLSEVITRLEREIRQEQMRLSKADENFSALGANFLEALIATRVPGVGPTDTVNINRRTLIPEIWPEGDETAAYSFFTAGSGGKKTLFTICFALALHRTAAIKGMPVPSLLIIDTPLKNITPDINPELVAAFYKYLYRIAETDLLNHQIVIIDQALVEPSPEGPLDFVDRLMTEDDPEHPPLISYYHGP